MFRLFRLSSVFSTSPSVCCCSCCCSAKLRWSRKNGKKKSKRSILVDPVATVKAVGAFNKFELRLDDGAESLLLSSTDPTISSIFQPTRAFYQLKASLIGRNENIFTESIVNVPSVIQRRNFKTQYIIVLRTIPLMIFVHSGNFPTQKFMLHKFRPAPF